MWPQVRSRNSHQYAVWRRHRSVFSDRHVRRIVALANLAAIAIENARLYQELRQARDELEVRVHARTIELIEANQQLQREVAEREEAEAAQQQTAAQG